MQKLSSITKRTLTLAGLLVGVFALSALADWSSPLSAPPTCVAGNPGCDAPINSGYGGQVKYGGLSLNGFSKSNGELTNYGLLVNNSPIKAAGGLIIETRTTAQGDPASPETGRMWLLTQ